MCKVAKVLAVQEGDWRDHFAHLGCVLFIACAFNQFSITNAQIKAVFDCADTPWSTAQTMGWRFLQLCHTTPA
jgi:hypothetical protein